MMVSYVTHVVFFIAGRFDQDFVEERRRLLELWLNRICRHPVLCASFPVQHFITCEVTDKDRKVRKSSVRFESIVVLLAMEKR